MKPIPLRKLKEETEVLDGVCPVVVKPSSWYAWGEVAPIRYNGDTESLFQRGEIIGYMNVTPEDDSLLQSDKLPVEFFNHEVMDYGFSEATEKETARRFLGAYGVPYVPFLPAYPMSEENSAWYEGEYTIRLEAAGLGADGFYRCLLSGAVELPQGAERIDAIRREMLAEYEKDEKVRYRDIKDDYGIRLFDTGYISRFKKALRGLAVSYWEVSAPIVEMMLAFGTILAAIDKAMETPNQKNFYYPYEVDYPEYALMLVNDWARPHKRLSGAGYEADANPSALVNAVCLQFIEAMEDPAPWRRCRKCGRLFKYQINHRNRGKRKGHDDAAYCSKRCADAGRQYVYRHSRL